MNLSAWVLQNPHRTKTCVFTWKNGINLSDSKLYQILGNIQSDFHCTIHPSILESRFYGTGTKLIKSVLLKICFSWIWYVFSISFNWLRVTFICSLCLWKKCTTHSKKYKWKFSVLFFFFLTKSVFASLRENPLCENLGTLQNKIWFAYSTY